MNDNVFIPEKLVPIVQAFFAESPQAAKKLVIQAVKAIYGSEEEKNPFDLVSRHLPIGNDEIEEVCSFMEGLKPKDTLEAIIASQIVVAHMLGMRKMASGFPDDQRLGLKMLRFSSDSIERLQKKRSGGVQNVTVNHNYNYNRPTPIQAVPLETHE